MDSTTLVQAVAFVILLGCSGFFSGSETALTSMTTWRVKKLGPSGTNPLHDWLEDPNKYLAILLVGNNLVNIMTAFLAERLTLALFFPGTQSALHARATAVAVAITTFALLVFGEFVPKAFCRRHAETISVRVIGLVSRMYYVLYPIIWITETTSGVIFFLLGQGGKREITLLTEEEIRTFIDVGEEDGVLEDEEREMIHSIIDFGDTYAREVMTPRMFIQALEIGANMEEALRIAHDYGHSRIPVYQESMDRIVGILYVKDLLAYMGQPEKPFMLRELIREPHFIPENKRVMELLRELQARKTHIAIVLDEYGGTAGLITFEDILEEIVGEIQDEYDIEEEPMLEVAADGGWVVDARMNLEEFQDEVESKFDARDCDSVGGYVSSLFGHIPLVGEEISSPEFSWKILGGDSRRVTKILARPIVPEETVDDES